MPVCMFVSVCAHTCVHAYLHARHIHACKHVCTCVCVCLCVHACMCVWLQVCVCVRVRVYVWASVKYLHHGSRAIRLNPCHIHTCMVIHLQFGNRRRVVSLVHGAFLIQQLKIKSFLNTHPNMKSKRKVNALSTHTSSTSNKQSRVHAGQVRVWCAWNTIL